MGGQGHAAQGQHAQQHGQQGHGAGYPYNHPYYGSPYYANYVNQFGGYGQGGAGYGSFGKGMYGQPHHYGPQTSFDQHSSSPANAGGFGASSVHERGSGMGGGFGDYGRRTLALLPAPEDLVPFPILSADQVTSTRALMVNNRAVNRDSTMTL
jgi:hypothetical protein